ncbi:MAG TPA: hypothetical protein DCR93_24005 [Cytophagales bacterium]|nr:hypothetical protein [Cytophagales bacterium]HAP62429.1 hypothetical protein [Cytophagales bacterium]
MNWLRKPKFFPQLQSFLGNVQRESVHIPAERRESLHRIRDYAIQRMNKGKQASVLFICAENCGRSILTQVWLDVMARAYELPQLLSYSGGTQPEALEPAMIKALEEAGIQVKGEVDSLGRKVDLKLGPQNHKLSIASKFFDDVANPKKNFMAITTDRFTQNFLEKVQGAHHQVPLVYDKPTSASEVSAMSFTIAAEMMYLAREIKRALDPMFVSETGSLKYTQLKPVVVRESHTAAA